MAQGNFSAELDLCRARREWATEQLANPNGDWDAAINAYQHPLQGMDATINLLTETMLATAGNIGNVGLAERVFVGGMAREVTAPPAMAGFFWFMRKKAPKAADDIPVIGRQPDTAVAKDWPGHRILDDPNWTIAKNDAWIQDIIEKRQRVYTGSPTNRPNVWDSINNRETIYGRELRQLQEAGYTWEGDFLVPPAP